eukprot:CAMPEP_0115236678 /NCGR_PEP_ID=MMETSP0270-20121206/35971_1 /TAXON_ID=71861 /ORGANISM="Scrippsiella trochoidea, Strain CCMP3099" /LENGTH=487 /DNA_ID=CAMNT_0002651541 /DNA_START=1 /DNA_END=1461 /DNA_ORIENTATION=-
MENKLRDALEKARFECSVSRFEPGVYDFGTDVRAVLELTEDEEVVASRNGEPFEHIDDFIRAIVAESRQRLPPSAGPSPEGGLAAEDLSLIETALDVSGDLQEETVNAAAHRVRSTLGRDACIVCILGGREFRNADSEALVKALAAKLGAINSSKLQFVTGGMAGVQETFAKHCGDGSRVWNLLPVGQQSGFGRGTDVHAGADLEERMAIFGSVGDVYVAAEGGPSVAQEARAAHARGAVVVPLRERAARASDGLFNFPQGALQKPHFASQELWSLLANKEAPVGESAAAASAIVEACAAEVSPSAGGGGALAAPGGNAAAASAATPASTGPLQPASAWLSASTTGAGSGCGTPTAGAAEARRQRFELMEEKLKEALDRAAFECAVTRVEPGVYAFGPSVHGVVQLTDDEEVVVSRNGGPPELVDDFIRNLMQAGQRSGSEVTETTTAGGTTEPGDAAEEREAAEEQEEAPPSLATPSLPQLPSSSA